MPFEELVDIMRKLRSPEGGCPWDRQQTRKSLTPFLVEETYEVLDAIESGKPDEIREELGDLLFQIVFHSQVADEAGEFSIDDVISGIRDKMVSRHPHVFGDASYDTPAEVLAQWEDRKKEEGKQRESLLSGIPATLPGLLRAQRLQERAARVGFDWEKIDDVVKKLDEEVSEFKCALVEKDEDAIEDELGDVLFMMVNIARFAGANPENALRRTIGKFIHRFRHIEMSAAESGRRLTEMTLAEMDALWDEAKEKAREKET
ncbi:MAG: nucleoside triphosphate pyrophosphohydrolase [Nitrospirae bacterium]|nr:nucleoside triphosphate pyrophosphohydrolase [Nitrospirota bacterium]